ncbi:MAG: hypothetical protein Q4G70_08985 [Pseudomonadota bacterium]|nr:hypothetical protein [Pseudomonadota bacterium]
MSAVPRFWLWGIVALLLAVAVGCGDKPPQVDQFVGKWRSSRMNTAPLYIHANGEWEIKSDDGEVMQFGVWELKPLSFVWYVKTNGQLLRDPNAIVTVEKNRFALRESDGSVTNFERID